MSREKDLAKKIALRIKRKKRVRANISGTAEKPRVSIFKSNKYISAQAINDVEGRTLAAVSSQTMGLGGNKEGAVKVAAEFASKLKAAGIETASGEPNKKKVAKVGRDKVREIAESKMVDLNAASVEAAMRMIEGTARSMGIEIVD